VNEEESGVKYTLKESLERAEEKLQDTKADINYEPRVNEKARREFRHM
jgi:hypothetical protein